MSNQNKEAGAMKLNQDIGVGKDRHGRTCDSAMDIEGHKGTSTLTYVVRAGCWSVN
jgi:hypothetical protein